MKACAAAIISVVLLAPFSASATKHRGPQKISVAGGKPANIRGLRWDVHGKKTVVHLFASIHVMDASIYPLPTAIEKAFETSTVLAVQVNTGGDQLAAD